MTEQEWLAHLDRFMQIDRSLEPKDFADMLDAFVRRVNTIVVSYVNREHDDTQANARRIDKVREDVADLRTIAEDHEARLHVREVEG